MEDLFSKLYTTVIYKCCVGVYQGCFGLRLYMPDLTGIRKWWTMSFTVTLSHYSGFTWPHLATPLPMSEVWQFYCYNSRKKIVSVWPSLYVIISLLRLDSMAARKVYERQPTKKKPEDSFVQGTDLSCIYKPKLHSYWNRTW